MVRFDLTIPSGNISLEAIWQLPDGEGNFPAVVICHPHPLHGGNMHNSVVYHISRNLLERGFATMRFNFRGVEKSGGVFGDGVKEQADVKAAINFVASQAEVDAGRLGLAGYSFGGGVSIPVAYGDKRVKALALVSPAVQDGCWEMLRQMSIPKMLISGAQDDFFPPGDYEREFAAVPEPKKMYVIPFADHFWSGFEAEVGQKVCGFFKENL